VFKLASRDGPLTIRYRNSRTPRDVTPVGRRLAGARYTTRDSPATAAKIPGARIHRLPQTRTATKACLQGGERLYGQNATAMGQHEISLRHRRTRRYLLADLEQRSRRSEMILKGPRRLVRSTITTSSDIADRGRRSRRHIGRRDFVHGRSGFKAARATSRPPGMPGVFHVAECAG